MCCEHLVCARCAGPVSEARCPVCQASRAQVHGGGVPMATIALLVTVLVVLAALLEVALGR